VGVGTARADDPTLTARVRRGRGHQPVRVILDTNLTLPTGLAVVRAPLPAPTLIVHAEGLPPRHPNPEVEHLAVRRGPGGVDLGDLLARLAGRGIVHLLVEGGSAVYARFLEAGLADRLVFLVAPKLAGADGVPVFALPGPARISDVMALTNVQVHRLGDDVLVEGTPAYEFAARAGAAQQ
jgi:diaminohydroxyphosphoribosylaminopyrimidine deaminase/5-amino-6-(5-phosphoribosylamino)uracil reductase